MSRLISMLVILAACAFPAAGYPQSEIPQNRVWFSFSMPVSQSADEAVEVLIAVGDLPGNREDSETVRITHGFELTILNHPIAPNGVTVDVPANGLAKFRIEVGHENSSGDAPLIVNGQEFCCVAVENNRVAYRVNLRRSENGVNIITGKNVPIPPSVNSSVTTTVIDRATGETRSSDQWVLRPVIKVDQNWVK